MKFRNPKSPTPTAGGVDDMVDVAKATVHAVVKTTLPRASHRQRWELMWRLSARCAP